MEPCAPGTEDEPPITFSTLKEQENERSRLQKHKAFLKNGKYDNVFLLTFINGDEEWYCNACECAVDGDVLQHEVERGHTQNISSTPYNLEPVAKESTPDKAVVLGVAPGEPLPPGFEEFGAVSNIQVTKVLQVDIQEADIIPEAKIQEADIPEAKIQQADIPEAKIQEADIPEADIQERLDRFKIEPLLGLEYLLELKDCDPTVESQYSCILCDKKGDPRTILTHLASINHIIQFLQKHFPICWRALVPYSSIKHYKRNYQITVQKIAEAIENKFGRLKPFPISKETFEKNKVKYIEEIEKDRMHFSERSGYTFEELVILDELSKTVEEEKPPERTSSTSKTSTVAVIQKLFKKRSPSPPVVAIPSKKVKGNAQTNPRKQEPAFTKKIIDTPASKPKDQPIDKLNDQPCKKPVEEAVPAAEPVVEASSRSPGSKISISSTSTRSSRSRSVSSTSSSASGDGDENTRWVRGRGRNAASFQRGGRQQFRYQRGFRPPYHRGGRPFQRGFRRPFQRGGRQQFHRGGRQEYQWDDRHDSYESYKSSTSHRRRSSERRKSSSSKRSHQSRSPSPTARRSQSPTYKAEQIKERLRKIDEFKKLSTAIEIDMFKTLQQHEKNPERHPQYNEEWKKFWNMRYKELKMAGADVTNHNFKPEWVEFWKKRVVELNNEEIKTRKEALRKRLDLTDEANPIKFKIGTKTLTPDESTPKPPSMTTQPDQDDEVVVDIENRDSSSQNTDGRRSRTSRRRSLTRHVRSKSRERSPIERGHGSRARKISSDRSESTRRSKDFSRDRDLRRSRSNSRNRSLSREKSMDRNRESSFEKDLRGKERIRVATDLPWERESQSAYRNRHPPHTRASPEDDDDDKEINVIDVLRILTALEDHLGSLGTKVIDLLVQALALEKNEANSSEQLLDNDIHCVLFETVKEKLKGQIMAGLVNHVQQRAFKNVIKKITSLMHLAGQRKRIRQKLLLNLAPVGASSSAIDKGAIGSTDKGAIGSTDKGAIGSTDKDAIRKQIADALLSQGKTHVSQAEMEQLIDAVVGMAEASKTSSKPVTTADFMEMGNRFSSERNQESQSKPANRKSEVINLDEITDYLRPSLDKNPYNIENISDYDLQILLQNFNGLSTEEQIHLINYLKKLESHEPMKVEKLRKFVNVDASGKSTERLIKSEEKEGNKIKKNDNAWESPFSHKLGEASGHYENSGNGQSYKENYKEKYAGTGNSSTKVNVYSEQAEYNFDDVLTKISKTRKDEEMEHSKRAFEEKMQDDKSKSDLSNAHLISELMSNISKNNSANLNLSNLLNLNPDSLAYLVNNLKNMPSHVDVSKPPPPRFQHKMNIDLDQLKPEHVKLESVGINRETAGLNRDFAEAKINLNKGSGNSGPSRAFPGGSNQFDGSGGPDYGRKNDRFGTDFDRFGQGPDRFGQVNNPDRFPVERPPRFGPDRPELGGSDRVGPGGSDRLDPDRFTLELQRLGLMRGSDRFRLGELDRLGAGGPGILGPGSLEKFGLGGPSGPGRGFVVPNILGGPGVPDRNAGSLGPNRSGLSGQRMGEHAIGGLGGSGMGSQLRPNLLAPVGSFNIGSRPGAPFGNEYYNRRPTRPSPNDQKNVQRFPAAPSRGGGNFSM